MFFASLRKNSSWRVVVCVTMLTCAAGKTMQAGYTADSLKMKTVNCLVTRNCPDMAGTFVEFLDRFIDLFRAFINPKDNRPKDLHVKDFTVMLDEFEQQCILPICQNPELVELRIDLMRFFKELRDLVKDIETTGNYIILGPKLTKNYLHLLPAKGNPLDDYDLSTLINTMKKRMRKS